MSPYGKVQFERRAFPRFQMAIPIHFEHELHPHLEVAGKTLDISEGGLQVILPDGVAVGDRLRIRMHLPDPMPDAKASHVIEVVTQVVWVKAAPDAKGCQAGLKFESIRPEDIEQIKRFEGLWLE